MADLPAVGHLGFALNLVDVSPFDIMRVSQSVIYARRLLTIDFDDVRDVVIGGVKYSVPRDVSVAIDSQVATDIVTFPDGRNAANAFIADPTYPQRYFAVSGTTSGVYAAQKFFRSDLQFSFFRYKLGTYKAGILRYANSLVETPLIRGLEGIPRPFDPSNESIVRMYRDFFRQYGSHIIHNVDYGARYFSTAWVTNKDSEINRMFRTNVETMFNGIPSNGIFDPSVKNQEQYKRFSKDVQYLLTVVGGM